MATPQLSTPTTTSLADAGLLVLRIGVGATMIQAGLRKAFDFNTTVAFMEGGGWRLPNFAAFMVTAAETAGGIALVLGLLTPLAACAVIAAMIDAWAVNVSAATFWSEPFNVPFLVAVGAAALLFTGAGSYSVDARIFGRWRFSPRVAMGLLVLAIAAALLTWILLNGSNPIHFTAPAG
jgi:putative oxidoreductase